MAWPVSRSRPYPPDETISPDGYGFWSIDLPTTDGARWTCPCGSWPDLRGPGWRRPVRAAEFRDQTGQNVTRQYLVGGDDGRKPAGADWMTGSYKYKLLTGMLTAPRGAMVQGGAGSEELHRVGGDYRPGHPDASRHAGGGGQAGAADRGEQVLLDRVRPDEALQSPAGRRRRQRRQGRLDRPGPAHGPAKSARRRLHVQRRAVPRGERQRLLHHEEQVIAPARTCPTAARWTSRARPTSWPFCTPAAGSTPSFSRPRTSFTTPTARRRKSPSSAIRTSSTGRSRRPSGRGEIRPGFRADPPGRRVSPARSLST